MCSAETLNAQPHLPGAQPPAVHFFSGPFPEVAALDAVRGSSFAPTTLAPGVAAGGETATAGAGDPGAVATDSGFGASPAPRHPESDSPASTASTCSRLGGERIAPI